MKTIMNIVTNHSYLLDKITMGSFNKPLFKKISGKFTINTIHSLGYEALCDKYNRDSRVLTAGELVKIPMSGRYSKGCNWKVRFVRYDSELGLFWGQRMKVDVNGENPYWDSPTLHKISDIVD